MYEYRFIYRDHFKPLVYAIQELADEGFRAMGPPTEVMDPEHGDIWLCWLEREKPVNRAKPIKSRTKQKEEKAKEAVKDD